MLIIFVHVWMYFSVHVYYCAQLPPFTDPHVCHSLNNIWWQYSKNHKAAIKERFILAFILNMNVGGIYTTTLLLSTTLWCPVHHLCAYTLSYYVISSWLPYTLIFELFTWHLQNNMQRCKLVCDNSHSAPVAVRLTCPCKGLSLIAVQHILPPTIIPL